MITLPILDLLLALAVTVPHPHDPKAISFSGVQGKATLSFRTLPYNPETVANGSGARFSWQGSITSEMAFTVGETEIPAGTYSVQFPGTLADGFKEASFVQGRGSEGITVPIQEFKVAQESDHQDLEVQVINKGFTIASTRDRTPVSGATFVLQINFGNLHRQLELKEVFKSDG